MLSRAEEEEEEEEEASWRTPSEILEREKEGDRAGLLGWVGMVSLPPGWRYLARPLEPSPLVRRRRNQLRRTVPPDDDATDEDASASYRPSSLYVADLSVYSAAHTAAVVPPMRLASGRAASEHTDEQAVSPATLLNLARRFPSHSDDELLLALRAAKGHGGDAVQILRTTSEFSKPEVTISARAAARGKWVRYADEEGDTYYAHEVTGEVKWEPPPHGLIRTMSEAEQRNQARALARRAASRSSSPTAAIDDDASIGGILGAADISAIETVAMADTPPITAPPNRQLLEEAARLTSKLRQESFSPRVPAPEPEPEPEPQTELEPEPQTDLEPTEEANTVVEVEIDAMYRYRCLAQAVVFSDDSALSDAGDDQHGAVVGVLQPGTVFSATELKMTDTGRLLVRYDGNAQRLWLKQDAEAEMEPEELQLPGVEGWVSLTVEGGQPILEAV